MSSLEIEVIILSQTLVRSFCLTSIIPHLICFDDRTIVNLAMKKGLTHFDVVSGKTSLN